MSTTVDNFPDYLSKRPASFVGRRPSYVAVPAFSVTGLESVDFPDLVRQYCYTATSDFTINVRPTKPTGALFTLCVKYRVGETVFRYKLWDGPTDPHAPLYTGQIIKQNFVFEIWNTQNNTAIELANDLNIIVSQRVAPTDYRVRTPVANNAALQTVTFGDYVLLDLTVPTDPVVGYNHRFEPIAANITEVLGTVTDWADTGSLPYNLDSVSGSPAFTAEDPLLFDQGSVFTPNIFSALSHDLSDLFLSAYQFFVFNTATVEGLVLRNGVVFSADSAGNPKLTRLNDSATILLTLTGAGVIEAGQPYVWYTFSRNISGTFYTDSFVYNMAGELIACTELWPTASIFTFGGFVLGPAVGLTFGEYLSYSSALTAAQIQANIDYLLGRYAKGGLPFSQNENIAWLDNA